MDYIIAGLGNPGGQYTFTRHNAGWIAMDFLSEKLGVKINRIKFRSTCAEAEIGGKKVLLMKPQTFMNLSGEAVAAAAKFYKIPPQHILVICDDINLPCAKLRIRQKGSDGGHNGLKNIILQLNSDEFTRIRIGVSGRTNPNVDLADWVLGRFTEEEQKALAGRMDDICSAAMLFTEGKTELAMSRYNG